MAQTVTNLPVMKETWVQSRGWEDPLEKGMATHSSILTWEIPWTEEPGGQRSPWGHKRVGHDLAMKQQTTNSFYQSSLEKLTHTQDDIHRHNTYKKNNR